MVLTPPAVEPEDPPINIKIMVISFEAGVSDAVSTELKPAVRAVTESLFEKKKAKVTPLHSKRATKAEKRRQNLLAHSHITT